MRYPREVSIAVMLGLSLAATAPGLALAGAKSNAIRLPTGQLISPTAAFGAIFERLNPHLADFPEHAAANAVTTALSPDRRTLLVLTSGYNLVKDATGKTVPAASSEYVFVWDVSVSAPIEF